MDKICASSGGRILRGFVVGGGLAFGIGNVERPCAVLLFDDATGLETICYSNLPTPSINLVLEWHAYTTGMFVCRRRRGLEHLEQRGLIACRVQTTLFHSLAYLKE